MEGRGMKEISGLSRRMYIRSIADMVQKWKDICNADITPNWNDMRNTVDMNKLSVMPDLGNLQSLDIIHGSAEKSC